MISLNNLLQQRLNTLHLTYIFKNSNHVKIKTNKGLWLNFYPSTGTINYDNTPKLAERGLDALLEECTNNVATVF